MFKYSCYNSKSYVEGYKLLSVLNALNVARDADRELLKEYVAAIKRELRKWSHADHEYGVGAGYLFNRRFIKSYGIDGYIELITFPEICTTMAEADEYFNDYVKMDYRPSSYDCTGQRFTGWYKLFQRGDKFYAYHRVSVDV